jgi:hypothetical protein
MNASSGYQKQQQHHKSTRQSGVNFQVVIPWPHAPVRVHPRYLHVHVPRTFSSAIGRCHWRAFGDLQNFLEPPAFLTYLAASFELSCRHLGTLE